MIADLWQDLQYAIRLLRKKPAFTTMAIAIMALGIGANTAIFSLIRVVLLRPLPFKDLHATILAALRFWQTQESHPPELTDIATDLGALTALTGAEIDSLCERLNP